MVKTAYDPCSTSQTNCLVKLLKTLVKEHPQTLNNDCKVMLSIRSHVSEKFETTVNQDVFIPFHFAAKSGEFSSFLNRQFWSAAKLLRNILHWQVCNWFMILMRCNQHERSSFIKMTFTAFY